MRLLLAILAILLTFAALPAQDTGDGRRAVQVDRFGISIRCPQAWTLIAWAENDRAFMLKLPQEEGSPLGYVACELALAPESLEEYQKRHKAADRLEQRKSDPARKLILNKIERIDHKQFGTDLAEQLGGRRLDSLWETTDKLGHQLFELRTRVIASDILYTFILACDQAHFEAYRLDFEEMLASVKLQPPETGLQRMPGGFWMQRDFRFALQLPPEWKPAFGPDDKALLFATGKRHKVFTDNLLVLASPARPLDLEELSKSFPSSIKKTDPKAEVAACRVVKQAGGTALETVVHTKRGLLKISILERRFEGDNRNYEVKFTCETGEFKAIEDELRKSLDSFREVAEPAEREVL